MDLRLVSKEESEISILVTASIKKNLLESLQLYSKVLNSNIPEGTKKEFIDYHQFKLHSAIEELAEEFMIRKDE